MSVPDIAKEGMGEWVKDTLCEYRTSSRIRYVSTGHRVGHATSVPKDMLCEYQRICYMSTGHRVGGHL
eukprot:2999383-Rhodomonas_salina.1